VTVVPKSAPSFGRTVKYHVCPFTAVPAGSVRWFASAACSTPFLNQRISLPLSASLSASA
jgi:hypothetical protein